MRLHGCIESEIDQQGQQHVHVLKKYWKAHGNEIVQRKPEPKSKPELASEPELYSGSACSGQARTIARAWQNPIGRIVTSHHFRLRAGAVPLLLNTTQPPVWEIRFKKGGVN